MTSENEQTTPATVETPEVVPVEKTVPEQFNEELQALLLKYPTIRISVGTPPININEVGVMANDK